MDTLTIFLKQTLILLLLGTFSFNQAMAKSDMEIMADVQKAREQSRQGDHTKHTKPVNEHQKFRGVFYGYLPCSDCDGIKITLSLKNKNNYLTVTQPARSPSREYFDKGKYIWDDKSRTVTLISRKDSDMQKYRIKDEGTLVQLTTEQGAPININSEKYTLRRGDTVKTRMVHIH